MQCPNSQVSECPGPSGSQGSQRFSRRSATVGHRLSTPRPAPVEPARPEQLGQRPPCGCTCTKCTTWDIDHGIYIVIEKSGPCGTASATPNLKGLQLRQVHEHLNEPLHSQHHGHLSSHNTNKQVNNVSKICTCWISTSVRTVCPVSRTVAVGTTVDATVIVVTGAVQVTVRAGVTDTTTGTFTITIGSHMAGKIQRSPRSACRGISTVSSTTRTRETCTTCTTREMTPRFERGGPSGLPTAHSCVHRFWPQ